MGLTLAQKILARASGKETVQIGEHVTAKIDVAMVHDMAMPEIGQVLSRSGVTAVWDTNKVVYIPDHRNPPPTVRDAEAHKQAKQCLKKYAIKYAYKGDVGICHQVMLEKGHVLPATLIAGTDSHTLSYGAFGAAGAAVGHAEMAYVLATGTLWFKVPETIKFDIYGGLTFRVEAKDIALYLAGKYSNEIAQYKAIEYTGEVCSEMSLDSRITMCNMSAEIGAKFAFFLPDKKVSQYLKGRTHQTFTSILPDEDAGYEKVFSEDISIIEPQVAFPFWVDNVRPISKVGNVRIDQAVLGSCTNGRLEDLRIAVQVMRDRKIHPDVRFLVVPASAETYQEAIREGIIQRLIEAGAIICNPGCGPCMGAHMGLLASGEICISSTNRNFKGRMGSLGSKVYLASPATVAASAISGRIADPRNN